MTKFYYVEYYDHASLGDVEGIDLDHANPVINKFVGRKVKTGIFDGKCEYTVFALEVCNCEKSEEEGSPASCMIVIDKCIKTIKEIEI